MAEAIKNDKMQYSEEIHQVGLASFEEELALFFRGGAMLNKDLESTHDNQSLGQVFTSPALARFMMQLIVPKFKPNHKVLDPCIGPNTFFTAIPALPQNTFFKGVEVDENLINPKIEKFYAAANKELILGSFFDIPITEKYDFIIQNPPYVRQELLMKGVNAKSTIQAPSTLHKIIPSKSNLYIYFLLKSILHLNKEGCLIAVIYDSWLYSAFGKFLKEAFLELGTLESIFHFRKTAFEGIEVGATVIKFVKTSSSKKSIAYYPLDTLEDIEESGRITQKARRIKKKEFFSFSFNHPISINTELTLFQPIQQLSKTKIRRGTSAIVNGYFLFKNKDFPEVVPLIKEVSQVKTYTVETHTSYILAVNGHLSKSTKNYLEKAKKQILLTPNKYAAVKKKIASDTSWYKIKPKPRGNFLFNYYMRQHIDFLYNPNRIYCSDNFYSLNIETHELAYVAILNSSITRLTILSHSRNQGNGLKKIQLYEFREVPIIRADKLPIQALQKLEILGKQLLQTPRYAQEQAGMIAEIDEVLLKTYNEQTNACLTRDTLIQEIERFFFR